ncbi:hypothetical protein MRX96_006436 [Rhipicephalus microplus]
MNPNNIALAKKYVKPTYVAQAGQAIGAHESKVSQLLEQGRVPDEGWDDSTIELLLHQFSMMDSNNFIGNSGVGEREARIASTLVSRRHYRMGHGIGRSGDICETQPKAAGSSLMNKLTNSMLLHMLQAAGATSAKSCFIVPMATGMCLSLCMLTFRKQRGPRARYVVWSRIDQKSCFKSILTAGFEPIVVELLQVGGRVADRRGDHEVQDRRAGTGVCRVRPHYHVVLRAKSARQPRRGRPALRRVRRSAPVVAGFDRALVDAIAQMYPGRASAAPTMDVFITLLSLGMSGFLRLRDERRAMFKYLQESLSKVAEKHGQRVLKTPNNRISMAMTVPAADADAVTGVGAMLFTRLPASALGLEKEEVDVFVRKLDKVLTKAFAGPKGESNGPEV